MGVSDGEKNVGYVWPLPDPVSVYDLSSEHETGFEILRTNTCLRRTGSLSTFICSIKVPF